MFGGVWQLVFTNIEVLNTLQATRLGGFFYEQANKQLTRQTTYTILTKQDADNNSVKRHSS